MANTLDMTLGGVELAGTKNIVYAGTEMMIDIGSPILPPTR